MGDGVVADDVDAPGCGPVGRCGGWPGRCRVPDRGGAGWPPAVRSCGRSRRRRRWPHPRRGPARCAWPARRRGRPTKCISEVPGFMKQVSTPWSTRVRMSAWAPFTAGPAGAGRHRVDGSKMVPGLRMPCGSKAALIRRMRSSLTGSSSSASAADFSRPDPVLAGDRPAQAEARQPMMSCRSRWRTTGSGWKTERWTLPSPA